ncbi:MAG TPA: hypothetical protein VFE47_05505 [Tepidisphaeraceae bacterium]|jgi:hypothetical protein|nr:hypothetical protein [Tepidisphaeraceae bacterium]
MSEHTKRTRHSAHVDANVDKILAKILASEALYGTRNFDHAVIYADVADVIRFLTEIESVKAGQVFTDIGNRFIWLIWRKVFVSSNDANVTLLWPIAGDTEVLKSLSVRFPSRVKWVYADESSRSWGYLEYSDGRLTQKILDPERVWVSGATNSDNLGGRGPRSFENMAAFLDAIKGFYEPLDRVWHFGAWDIPEEREQRINASDTKYHWAVEIDYCADKPVISHHGPVPQDLCGIK